MDACIVCKRRSGVIVETPALTHIKDMFSCAKRRYELGELKYEEMAKLMFTLSDDDMKKVCYHSACRKLVINKEHMKRVENRAKASTSDSSVQPRKGRPVKRLSDSCIASRPKRQKTTPNLKVCIFNPDRCVADNDEDIHQVTTDNRGITLMKIKEETNDDSIRCKLSNLFAPGDAAAQEIWYHRTCFRSAERTCNQSTSDNDAQRKKMMKTIADAQVCNYVRNELISGNKTVAMKDVNEKYETILRQYNIHDKWHHKKHLKGLISKHIPETKFVTPVYKKGEIIISTQELDEAVEKYCDPESTVANCLKVANVLRQEILQSRDWKFTGTDSLKNYQNPPLTRMFVEALLCGPLSLELDGHRKNDADSSVNMISQLLIHNALTNRQIKYKSEESFKRVTETPLSVMLPLSVHHKTRSKNLTSLLSEAYVGNNYYWTNQIEQRVHQAIISRMEDTGYGVCLPDFVKKDKPVFFAVDNIDFLEDTPCGKDTLHGTVVVMYQKEETGDKNDETINKPLHIPQKLVTNPPNLKIRFKQAPKISLKPIKFEQTQYQYEKK